MEKKQLKRNPLMLRYDTTKGDGSRNIILPLKRFVDVFIDWGDGITQYCNLPLDLGHKYKTDGEYIVKIYGQLMRFGSDHRNIRHSENLVEVLDFGTVGLVDISGAFKNAVNLVKVPKRLPKSITRMVHVFNGAVEFNHPNIIEWDVSNVTNMKGLFDGALKFNQPIGKWDTSSVLDMSYLFSRALEFNQPIGNWDVSNVIYMQSMFNFATKFNQPIGDWDVSNVRCMDVMFNKALNFNQPIGNWNVSNVECMNLMFRSALTFNQDISGWDLSSVKEMNFMFKSAKEFDRDLSKWGKFLKNKLSIININEMFSAASSFNKKCLNSWFSPVEE